MVRTLVIGKTLESANYFLGKLLLEMDTTKIDKIEKNNNGMRITYKNEDYFQSISASEYLRGFKVDKVYLEVGIDNDIIDNVISFLTINRQPESFIYFKC